MDKKDRSGGDKRIVQAGNSRTDNPSYPLPSADDAIIKTQYKMFGSSQIHLNWTLQLPYLDEHRFILFFILISYE